MIPKVKSKNNELREGRGFSIGEILGAGATLGKAAELKLGIDRRRRSAHSFNIDIVKQAILKEKQITKAPKKKAAAQKKTEKKK